MLLESHIRTASSVRDKWSDTLDEVEHGAAVTITRRDHEPATIIDRRRYLALVQQAQDLEELAEVCELMMDLDVLRGVAEAEAQIERGEGLSFEEAFGEKL